MSKCIYQPNGAAGEYSQWACNLYVGCSNQCSYCYLKHGPMSGVLGGTAPTLKKSLGTPDKALEIFKTELAKYRTSLTGSLFFTFTSDPCLPETIDLNMACMSEAMNQGIPCTLLTKRADFMGTGAWNSLCDSVKNVREKLRVGFTLTGRDDLEPYASPNSDRLEAMKVLHSDGFYTWASVEPVMDLTASYGMVAASREFCQFYKIGLPSGCRIPYSADECKEFVKAVWALIPGSIITWKTSIRDYCSK